MRRNPQMKTVPACLKLAPIGQQFSYLDLFSRSTTREFCPAVPWQLHSLPWDRGIASLNAIAEILIFYSHY